MVESVKEWYVPHLIISHVELVCRKKAEKNNLVYNSIDISWQSKRERGSQRERRKIYRHFFRLIRHHANCGKLSIVGENHSVARETIHFGLNFQKNKSEINSTAVISTGKFKAWKRNATRGQHIVCARVWVSVPNLAMWMHRNVVTRIRLQTNVDIRFAEIFTECAAPYDREHTKCPTERPTDHRRLRQIHTKAAQSIRQV